MSKNSAECLMITIVGVLPPATEDANKRLHAFMRAVERELYAALPDFVPGSPPVTFSVSRLPRIEDEPHQTGV